MEVLEVASKPHLVSDGCVATRLKMLTYYRVCCAFDSTCALPSNTTWGFETTSRNDFKNKSATRMFQVADFWDSHMMEYSFY